MQRILALLLVVWASAAAVDITYPIDANLANVITQFGAKGDGVADDTAAIQAALTAKHKFIYLPAGTYLVSGTLRWGGEKNQWKRQILAGAGMGRTIIKLAPGTFPDAAKPQPVLWTGTVPAQRFFNGIRDLTVACDGNAGAIGVEWYANNIGAMRRVAIHGDGVIGLDLTTSDQGPCLIDTLEVRGFAVGIAAEHGTCATTLTNITLREQREAAIRNRGHPLAIEGLRVEGVVPALDDQQKGSQVVICDAELIAPAGTPGAALRVSGELRLDRVRVRGWAETVAGLAADQTDFWLNREIVTTGTSKKPLDLPRKPFPNVALGDPATWKVLPPKSDAAALQALIDGGAEVVALASTHYDLNGEVILRGKLKALVGLLSDVNRCKLTLMVGAGSAPVVEIADLEGNYGELLIRHQSPRTLVVRDVCATIVSTSAGAGDLFLDDVCTLLDIDRTSVWARQLNPESNNRPKIVNAGGSLRVLGLKTEGLSTVLETTGAGRSDILGGLIYANNKQPKTLPMLLVADTAQLSFTCSGANFTKPAAPFTTVLGGAVEIPAKCFPGRTFANSYPLLIHRPE